MTFVPQQSGRMRKLPFKVVTFCYHPNMMDEKEFEYLEAFLTKNEKQFISFPVKQADRHKTLYDKALELLYFVKKV